MAKTNKKRIDKAKRQGIGGLNNKVCHPHAPAPIYIC